MTNFRELLVDEVSEASVAIAKKFLAVQEAELLAHLKQCNSEELKKAEEWLDQTIFCEEDIAEMLMAEMQEVYHLHELRDLQCEMMDRILTDLETEA